MTEQNARIRSRDITLVPIDEIRLNPKNRNKHTPEQIERLAELIKYQGFRNPMVISNRSGIAIAGEGRYHAAKLLGMTHVPVTRQDFDSEEQEYAYGISDNAIAAWAEIDLSGINIDIGDIGPIDIDMLGLRNFNVVPEFEPGTEDDQGKLDQKQPKVVQCPNCGENFDANEAKPQD